MMNGQNGANGQYPANGDAGGTVAGETRCATSLPGGQLILLEAESDEALLMTPAQRRKIFTADLAQKIEERLDPILTLIACRLSIATVAQRCHISNNTVARLIMLFSAKIARDMEEFSGMTGDACAAFLALAYQKAADELPKIAFKDLVAASSFMGKLSLDMKLASTQMNWNAEKDGDSPLQLETENPALVKARQIAERIWAEDQDKPKLTNSEREAEVAA